MAAVDETTAAEAIEKITVDLERLPFVIDPIDSLRPGGPDARTTGNVFTVGGGIKRVKWTSQDLQEVAAGRIPWNAEAGEETSVGDCRRGIQAGRPHPGRNVLSAVDAAPAARVALGDGLLAEWKAVPPRLDAERRPDDSFLGAVGRDRPVSGRPRLRVLRWRFRQQGARRQQHGDPGAAVKKDRPSGDDADLPRGGNLHRPHAARLPGAREDRLPQGRPHHGDGLLHHRGQRSVRASGR